jgi:O-antigen/teichoic acid export membrane protein
MLKRLFSTQLRINVASGTVLAAANTVILAVSYRIYLHHLGYETYGLWLVLSTVLTFAQLGNLGISQAVMKLVAEEYGRDNPAGVQQCVTSACATLACSGTVVLLAVIAFGTHIVGLFRLSETNAAAVLRLLPYVACLSVYVMIVQAINATLSGLGRMDLANAVQTCGRIVALSVAAVLLARGWGVNALLVGSLSMYLLIHAASLALVRWITPFRVLRVSGFSIVRIRHLMGFGSGVFGASLLTMLVNPFNKLMLSRYSGVASITVYEVAVQGAMQIRALADAGLRALVPEVSRIGADMTETTLARIRRLHDRMTKLAVVAAGPVYVVLMLFAPLLFQFWLGERYVLSLPGVFRVMAVGSFISLIGVPAYHTLLGIGDVKACFYGVAIPAAVNVACVTAFVMASGLLRVEYVAYSFTTGTALSTLYLLWKHRRRTNGQCGV